MKAIQIHKFGGPEVLMYEDAPKPKPHADDVVIKVFATSVNPIDWKIREGHAKEKFPSKFPLIPGWDVSGEIDEVGSNILNFRKGDEVYGRPDPTKNGAYAEYVVVNANLINPKPYSIDHENAAAVPLAGLTAWQALFDHGDLQQGQKVLIHAASGGVGTFAVQLAKWKGAYVIGTTSKVNLDFVKKLGADKVIDYKNEKFENKLKNIDLVIDLIGGDTQKRSLKVIKKGGRLITTVQITNKEAAREKNIHIGGFLTQSIPEELEQIKQLIDSGKIKPVIAKVMLLKDAAEAQKLSEEGHVRGKIVLQVV